MTRYLALRSLAVAALLGTCFAAPAGDSLPFHGSGIEKITGGGPGFLVTDGEGVATHLGHFTRHLLVFIDGDTLDGDLVITAANGDELWIHLDGAFSTLSGTYTITGGTGRFSDASGSAEFSAAFISADTAEFSFDGTISY